MRFRFEASTDSAPQGSLVGSLFLLCFACRKTPERTPHQAGTHCDDGCDELEHGQEGLRVQVAPHYSWAEGTPVAILSATNNCRLIIESSCSVPASPRFSWGPAAVSNAMWTGVWVKDILEHVGIKSFEEGGKHVCFVGADKLPNGYYGTSIRREVCPRTDASQWRPKPNVEADQRSVRRRSVPSGTAVVPSIIPCESVISFLQASTAHWMQGNSPGKTSNVGESTHHWLFCLGLTRC